MLKWIRNLKFSLKLSFGFGIIFLLILVATGLINYIVFYDTIDGLWEDRLNGISDDVYKMTKSNVESQVFQRMRGIADTYKSFSKNYYNLYVNNELTQNEAKSQVLQIMETQKIGEQGYLYIINSEGKVVMHPQLSVGFDMSNYDFVKTQKEQKVGYLEYNWKKEGEQQEREKALYMTYFEEWDWIITVTLYVEEYLKLIDKSIFRDEILDIKVGKTDYPYIFNTEGVLELHPTLQGENLYNRQDENGKYFVQEMIEKKTGKVRYLWEDNNGAIRWKTAFLKYYDKLDWIVVVAIYEEEIYEPVFGQVMITLIIIGAAILILIPVLIFYSIMVTRPLKKVENVINILSHGNLSVRCDIEGKDEFGSLSKSINNLSERFEKIITSVARSVDGFYAATSEISEGNQDLSQRTSEQASSLQEITASIEEMLTKIDNTLTNSERAKELSNTIKEETEKLNESSKQMHEIIQVIESISFETNLLALNASIEAARAGEAGRGFEVVATEVKELSQRSSSQAKEIYTIIEDNINRIKHNVSLVENIDDIIAEITESSKDQHNASHQISESISQLNNVTQENAGLVEEAAAASEEISSQAKSLKDEIAFFSSKKVDKLPTGLDEVIPSEKDKEGDKVKHYIEHIKNDNMNKEDEKSTQNNNSDESNNNFKKF